jgi:predicted dienelactone hydrolase
MKSELILEDGAGQFKASVFGRANPLRTVVFGVGAGGDPGRHAPLLQALAEQGLMVVAPHFGRLTSPIVRAPELALRISRLGVALDYAGRSAQPVVVLGHSIGAATLLGFLGGRMRVRDGTAVDVPYDSRIARAVLMTPAMDFFREPGALDSVAVPIQVWAGSLDAITPPAQAEYLKDTLATEVDARLVEGAGHFSFMDEPPPHVADPLTDRATFLARLASDVGKFLLV